MAGLGLGSTDSGLPPTHGRALIKTTFGDLEVELWPREARGRSSIPKIRGETLSAPTTSPPPPPAPPQQR